MASNLNLPKKGEATLVIENFSKEDFDTLRKDELVINEQVKVNFGLYARTNNLCYYGHSLVYLGKVSGPAGLEVLAKVSILDNQKKKLLTNEYHWKFQNYHNHISHFSSFSSLLSPDYGYLYYDKLTVEILEPKKEDYELIQKSFSQISADFGALFKDDDKFRDFTFVVSDDASIEGDDNKEEKQFKVHKTILAARSPVFAAMFGHDFEEAKQNRVLVSDIAVEVFDQLLRYIYTGKVDSIEKYSAELLVAAEKYQILSLKSQCEQQQASKLALESVADTLLFADMYGAEELKTKCIAFIAGRVLQVKQTDGWKRLETRSELLVVRESRHLNIFLYYDIFFVHS